MRDDAAVPAPTPPTLDRSQLRPHFDGGDAHRALVLVRERDLAGATEAVERALAGAAEASARHRLEILAADIDRRAERWKSAAVRFAAAAERDPLLADYLHFSAARSFARAGQPEVAAEHAGKVAADSPWAADMQFLSADAARAAGRDRDAIDGYRAYLEQQGSGELALEARYGLASAEARLGDMEAAARGLRELTVVAPTSSWGERASADLAALPLTDAARAALDQLTVDELLTRGGAYFEAMRNKLSEADYAAVLERPGISDEQRCTAAYHRAESVFKQRSYRRSAPLFEPAVRACEAAGDVFLEIRSNYQAGRAYMRARKYKMAAAAFKRIEEHPEHSYADDARLRRAEAYDAMGDQDTVSELLSTLPELYQQGDMRGEALWRLAWRAYLGGEYEKARDWLHKSIELVPIETNWWAEGQAQYWLARTWGQLGDEDKATEAYVECVRRYPLTYYSLHALNRLREASPERADELVAEQVKAGQQAWTMTFRSRPVYAQPAFARALELARLGLAEPAVRQLVALGFTVPAGRTAATDPDELDKLWATAFLYDLAGDYESSHWITRWHALDYRRSWPAGDNARRWRVAYPLAFAELIEQAAGARSYPWALQMGIMREESAFDPERESYANAIGLTQMIFPTARRFAAGTGIEVSRETLRDPRMNVTIGSNFLDFLWKTFEGRVGLVPPSYNAGEGRVWSWMWKRHRAHLDEWTEEINRDQPRRYTKRVLSSYFVYAFLADGTVPELHNQVPKQLVPRHKR